MITLDYFPIDNKIFLVSPPSYILLNTPRIIQSSYETRKLFLNSEKVHMNSTQVLNIHTVNNQLGDIIYAEFT